MVGYGQASHKEIWEMLDHCCPGWTRVESGHFFRVMWKGRTYAALPKGQHGKKQGRAEVEVGHVKHMIRQLGIDMGCARKHLDCLR